MKVVFPIIVAYMCLLTFFIAKNPAQEAASVTMFMMWIAASYVVAVVEESK